MKCSNIKCDIEHDSSFGSGKFCSRKCANSRNHTNETKNKISKSLTIDDYIKICPNCKNQFKTKRNKNVFCSISCGTQYNWLDETYKKKMSLDASKRAIERHNKNDYSFGWQSRIQRTPSYPESIAIRFFEKNGIFYNREVKYNKYFLDFVIPKLDNLVIEIDGKQHSKPERIIIDNKKDRLLHKDKRKIIRIKYPQQNIIKELNNIFKIEA